MGINIKSISLKDIGPVPELTKNLGNINLIFGDNESGKSFIVEFLIRSMFKAPGWNLREKIGSGKVIIEGLTEDVVEFSPESSKKLEDFLSGKYIGLPPDFSKLLVLRGTNVELGKEDEPDKKMLRRYLSHKEILDKIKNDIQKTVRECDISGYTITGDNRGKLKSREELKGELERIEELFADIENEFLGGELKTLKDREKELEKKFNELEKAKGYKAYNLSNKIEKLEEEKNHINEEKIDKLIEEVNKLNGDKRTYNQDQKKLKSLEKSTKGYEWLDSAMEEYEKYNLGKITQKPSGWTLVLLGSLVLVTGTLIVSGLQWYGIAGLVASAVIGTLYIRTYSMYVEDGRNREELKNLKEDFKRQFGEELSNLAVMNEKKESMRNDFNRKNLLEENLVEDEKNIEREKDRLFEEISNLLGEEVEENRWKDTLKKEEKRKRDLEREMSAKNIELSGLQVAKSAYIRSSPKIEFNWDGYEDVKGKLEKVRENIGEKENNLTNLKDLIREHTEDSPSIGWMELIGSLATKRDEILNEYRELTSEIIANKYVCYVIEELYEEEDEKIEEALSSEVIKKTLPKVTTHYEDIYLEDGSLIVSDPFKKFPVSEISDGAKEQVFLALRIGFAKQWFKKDELFLILDDAFIHSDTNRRPELVDRVVELGKSGWQILCFTFDERIKELFDRSGEKYQFINLNKL